MILYYYQLENGNETHKPVPVTTGDLELTGIKQDIVTNINPELNKSVLISPVKRELNVIKPNRRMRLVKAYSSKRFSKALDHNKISLVEQTCLSNSKTRERQVDVETGYNKQRQIFFKSIH